MRRGPKPWAALGSGDISMSEFETLVLVMMLVPFVKSSKPIPGCAMAAPIDGKQIHAQGDRYTTIMLLNR